MHSTQDTFIHCSTSSSIHVIVSEQKQQTIQLVRINVPIVSTRKLEIQTQCKYDLEIVVSPRLFVKIDDF